MQSSAFVSIEVAIQLYFDLKFVNVRQPQLQAHGTMPILN